MVIFESGLDRKGLDIRVFPQHAVDIVRRQVPPERGAAGAEDRINLDAGLL